MTGQLFVVPASLPRRPVRAARAVARRRARAAVPRHPQVRPDRAVRRRRRPVRRRRARAAGPAVHPARVPAADPRPPRRASSRCSSTRRSSPGVGNIYADEALWRSKLHPLRTARSLRPADERRAVPPHREVLAEAVERRGSLDRRLHGARRRRRDAGAPRRLPAHRRAVPPLRAADPADRDRHPRDALLLVVPAAARRASARGAAPLLRTMTPRPGRAAGAADAAAAGSSSTGEGALGRTDRRGRAARATAPTTDGRRGRDPARGRPTAAPGRRA